MRFQDSLEWIRDNSHSVAELAKTGDSLALAVQAAYENLYRDRLNPRFQNAWLSCVDDYVRRDLDRAARRELEERFGYKLRRGDSGISIIVPDDVQ